MVHQWILDELREAGYRVTPQRAEIAGILSQTEHPLTAQEVHEKVAEHQPHVSLDTVYRTLRLMARLGFVHELNVRATEERRYHLDHPDQHHHHLICLDCGRIFSMAFCPLDLEGWRPPDRQEFQVVSHLFETYGYCGACQA